MISTHTEPYRKEAVTGCDMPLPSDRGLQNRLNEYSYQVFTEADPRFWFWLVHEGGRDVITDYFLGAFPEEEGGALLSHTRTRSETSHRFPGHTLWAGRFGRCDVPPGRAPDWKRAGISWLNTASRRRIAGWKRGAANSTCSSFWGPENELEAA